jgi:hypothetical protein
MVTAYLSNPAHRAAREAQIRQRYRSTNWSETAQAIRSVLEGTVA